MLVQITERVPPAFDGIADYATVIATRIRQIAGYDSIFIPVRERGVPESPEQFSNLAPFTKRLEDRLREIQTQLNPSKIVLLFHFNTGGLNPLWLHWKLNKLLASLKRKFGLHLVVFIHETLPSHGARRLFRVLRPLQLHALRSLLTIANDVITSNLSSADCLVRAGCDPRPREFPICSTIGEPACVKPFEARSNTLLVFGSPSRVLRSLNSLSQVRDRLFAELAPREIRILTGGRGAEQLEDAVTGLRSDAVSVRVMLNQSASEISQHFLESKWIFLDYFFSSSRDSLNLLAKSTIFAAANSHGVGTVLYGADLLWQRDLSHPGVAFIRPDFSDTSPLSVLPGPEALNAWYHDACHSRLFASYLVEICNRDGV